MTVTRRDFAKSMFIIKNNKGTKKFKEVMRRLIINDLGVVEMCDAVLVNYTGEKIAGTVHEVGHAWELGIPTVLVSSCEVEDIPGWFLGLFDYRCDNFEKAVEILREIRQKLSFRR